MWFRSCNAWTIFVAATVSCAPAVFSGHEFNDGRAHFTLREIPPAYDRIDVATASLAFRDRVDRASILINVRCETRDEDTPLPALTNHLLMGTTERDFRSQEIEPWSGREAHHSVLTAKQDGVRVLYDLFVAKKDGCIYDFVYVADLDAPEAGRHKFESMFRAVKVLPGARRQ